MGEAGPPDGSRALEVAVAAARAGGRAALPFYGSASVTNEDPRAPVTEADRASNAAILGVLRAEFPGAAIRSEEGGGSAATEPGQDLWIVDPLDGTKEFLAMNGEFSVMVGMARGGRAWLGAVYAPAEDRLYAAERGVGAWLVEGGRVEPLRARATPGRLAMVGSRSHADPLAERMAAAAGATATRPCGSVGLKCGLIARGVCDLYAHPVPYLKEWDTCAPEIVLTEAGGRVTDCRGEVLRYGKDGPVQPDGILAWGPGVPDAAVAVCLATYAGHAREGVVEGPNDPSRPG